MIQYEITHTYISVFHIYNIIYNTKETKITNKNINRLINVIYYYINVCYNYCSIDYINNLLIYSLTLIYRTYFLTSFTYRQQLQFGSGKS